MHRDQSTEPVVHVTQKPAFVNEPDGTIRAYYPGEDWHVTAADRAEAITKLGDEVDRRMQDPAYIAQHFALAQQHLNGDAVTPGFEVETLSAEQYEQHTNELGDQLRHP